MSSVDSEAAARRFRFLAEAAAWRYRSQGFVIRWKVRERILRDTVYREILISGRLPRDGLIVELGCGRGSLLALLACERTLGMGDGAKVASRARLMGVESIPEKAESARLALAQEAEIIAGDIRGIDLPPCRAVIILHELVLLEPKEQLDLLTRVSSALESGGCLIILEPDSGHFPWGAAIRFIGRILAFVPRKRNIRFYPRSSEEWTNLIESLGLTVDILPADGRLLPGQALLFARKS